MARTITLRVLTHEGLVVEDETVAAMAHGEIGYLGMLANHAPLVTTLQPGKLTWCRSTGEQRTLLIGAGVLEIARNQLTVLTDSISEPPPAASV